jgi:hypothetical protein
MTEPPVEKATGPGDDRHGWRTSAPPPASGSDTRMRPARAGPPSTALAITGCSRGGVAERRSSSSRRRPPVIDCSAEPVKDATATQPAMRSASALTQRATWLQVCSHCVSTWITVPAGGEEGCGVGREARREARREHAKAQATGARHEAAHGAAYTPLPAAGAQGAPASPRWGYSMLMGLGAARYPLITSSHAPGSGRCRSAARM